MTIKKATIDDTLKTDKTYTVFLENGETVSITAASAAEAVTKATTKE
jgi:hypothetical protein